MATDTSNDPWSQLFGSLGNLATSAGGAVGSQVASDDLNKGYTNMIAQQQGVNSNVASIYAPQRALGTGADANLASVLGLNGAKPNYAAFENAPGYQFALQQSQNAINRGAAAGGNAYSTTTLNALSQNAAGFASQNYNNYVNQLMGAAGLGQQANAGVAGAALQTGNNIGQGLVSQGAANASGVLGTTGALLGGGAGTAGGGANASGAGNLLQNIYGAGKSLYNIGSNLFGGGGAGAIDTSGFTGDAFNNAFDSSGLNDLGSFSGASGQAATGTAGQAAGTGFGVAQGVGALGGALGTYNAIKNFQGGATGGDALRGAEAGAGWGTAVLPGVGTAIGALIGGGVGALSSLAGNAGAKEAALSHAVDANVNKLPVGQQTAAAASLAPAQATSYIQSIMSAQNNTAGHSTGLEMAFGKNNVAGFTTAMNSQLTSALKSGRITAGMSPAQVYQSVVAPWLASKNASLNIGAIDSKGNQFTNTLTGAVQSLIGSWLMNPR